MSRRVFCSAVLVQTLALALGEALVGDVAHHPVAEAPDVGAISVVFEQLLLLEPAERLAGRDGDQVELGEGERRAGEHRGLTDQISALG
jgi:hypothetical protein